MISIMEKEENTVGTCITGLLKVLICAAPPGWLSGEHVGLMTWWLRVPSLVKATFFLVYFRLSPLQKHVRKVVGGFAKRSVSTGVRKPGNTYMYASPTAMI